LAILPTVTGQAAATAPVKPKEQYMDSSTVIFFSVLAIPALSGLVLPWLMVRQGYREIVGMFCFITSVLSLALIAGVVGQAADLSVMVMFAGCAVYAVLMAINCALPLWLTRKSVKR
jgi:hypothetical protein